MNDSMLGKQTEYPAQYAPELLHPIPRSENRAHLGISQNGLPFQGADIWNAYEISYLNAKGKPIAMQGRLVIPCNSPFMVESKSLKLYLNSHNQEKYTDNEAYRIRVIQDISAITQCEIDFFTGSINSAPLPEQSNGICLDALDIDFDEYQLNGELLKAKNKEELFDEVVEELLFTDIFRSNCPVTNQPDWATVTLSYRGIKIPHDNLLRYLVSYRQHNDYHENCVERIFCDLMQEFNPQYLTVEANFLRRGGLDINPVRTTEKHLEYIDFPRLKRQ